MSFCSSIQYVVGVKLFALMNLIKLCQNGYGAAPMPLQWGMSITELLINLTFFFNLPSCVSQNLKCWGLGFQESQGNSWKCLILVLNKKQDP